MASGLRRLLRARRRDAGEAEAVPPLPLRGFDEDRTAAPFVELLDDASLEQLNGLLPWRCFTVDSLGRRFGDRAKPWKNQNPRPIPDPRVVLADDRFALTGKRVLEVGSFEGVHTIALCQRAEDVVAVDARIVNVAKTAVRCAMYGVHPTVFMANMETWDPDDFDFDVVFHIGVLYHLRDPVKHVLELGRVAGFGLLLDTHVAEEHEATQTYSSDGVSYRYRWMEEISRLPAAGMYDHAKWLRIPDLVDVLHRAGFAQVEVLDKRIEGTGTRVTIVALKDEGA